MKKTIGTLLILFIVQLTEIVEAFPNAEQIVDEINWVRSGIKEITKYKNKSKVTEIQLKIEDHLDKVEDNSLRLYLYGLFIGESSYKKERKKESQSFLRQALDTIPKPQKFLETLILEKILSQANQKECAHLKRAYPNNLIFKLEEALSDRKNKGDQQNVINKFASLIQKSDTGKKSDLYIKLKAHNTLACICWVKDPACANRHLYSMNHILSQIKVDRYTRGKMFYFIGSFMKENYDNQIFTFNCLDALGYLKRAYQLLTPCEINLKYTKNATRKINEIMTSEQYSIDTVTMPSHWALHIED